MDDLIVTDPLLLERLQKALSALCSSEVVVESANVTDENVTRLEFVLEDLREELYNLQDKWLGN